MRKFYWIFHIQCRYWPSGYSIVVCICTCVFCCCCCFLCVFVLCVFVLCVFVLCVFVCASGYSQQILGNCLCNSTDHTNYEPDDECIPTGSCQDNRAPDPDAFFWGCRIFITPNPSTLTSEMLIQQSCISNALDNSIFCMPSTEEERDANVIVTVRNLNQLQWLETLSKLLRPNSSSLFP